MLYLPESARKNLTEQQNFPEKILPLSECYAKTYSTCDDEEICAGRTVFEHCLIVGAVAREIMARLPSWLRVALFPAGAELIAAAHDIGKISPTFQEKIYRNIEGVKHSSKSELKNADPDLEQQWGGHAGVSQATVNGSGDINAGEFIPEILGIHHGYQPNLGGKSAAAAVFGGQEWQNLRAQCLDELKAALQCAAFPKVNNDLHAKVLAGLTTVADWIGSGSHFENPAQPWQPHIQQALDDAGFVVPQLRADLTFDEIFGFTPRDAQLKLMEHAVQPGLYIMEAPMGAGKTEAALYAAYLALAAGTATGIYFALPTQLTSDKIYDRVNPFLQKILALDCRHREALLLHGNAWLRDAEEIEMGEEGAPGGSWFQVGKRGILAPFAVGTIDQALMAVMNVKHGFVRTFGLVGKVVILDEVHSYDVYTSTILDKLVAALRELHCTVIILSATLTKERRHKLLALNDAQSTARDAYPLISVLPKNASVPKEIAVPPPPAATVAIRICQGRCGQIDELAMVIDEALRRAEEGQQILWIENTVREAQEIFRRLAAQAIEINSGIECGLLHSRFLRIDRTRNEAHWVDLYGKESAVARGKLGHSGKILVGTQVLEQSLDIDADFLVTRMCPTDMLLQRLGRLWRHRDAMSRPASAIQEAWILAPTLRDALQNPCTAFGDSAKVYSPYVLCRSLEVWEQLWAQRRAVILPTEIRELLEATYAERAESGTLSTQKAELERKRDELQGKARVGMSHALGAMPESKASTRYSEQDNVEVLLIRSYRSSKDKNQIGTYVTLLNGEEIYLPRSVKLQSKRERHKRERHKKAATLVRNSLCVADYLAPRAVNINELAWLKGYLYLGDKYHDEALLRVAKVRDDGDELAALNGGSASDSWSLSYDDRLGYQAKKSGGN